MNTIVIFFRQNVLFLSVLLFTGVILTNCKSEPQLWTPKSDKLVAGDYITSHPEKFTEFAKLVELTGFAGVLNIRGPYTIMLPTDEAMKLFYKENTKTSINDFDLVYLKRLIRNHIITNEIYSNDIGLGALRDTNSIGDFIVTEFVGADILLNKKAKIIDRDIKTANGFIHVIDRVLEPIDKDVYTILANEPGFSIFSKGVELSGIKDTLQTITFPYGKRVARTRFTLLAVPDSIYQKNGIDNVDELVLWCGGSPDNVTSINDPFYRYIEYHCLAGTYYLSSFESGIYPVLSRDNNINIRIEEDYKINLNRQTMEYTHFITEMSNIPAKNGAIHTVNGLLPVIDPEPGKLTFETTDFFDLQQGDYYGKYYMKWADGLNTFSNIKFEGDYLLYYYKKNAGRPLIKDDCLSMFGYWWIEIETPKVMKGKYVVGGNIWVGSIDMPAFNVYVDGVLAASIDAKLNPKMEFGEFTFTKTETHKIKLVCTNFGTLFWDTITFTPVKD